MHYSSEKDKYSQQQNEWKYKFCDSMFATSEQFKKVQEQKIRWANEQQKINHYKSESAMEILKIIESL